MPRGSGNRHLPQLPAAHEWVSFDDPHELRTWTFDVTFLLSPWTCIFGRGCPGVLTAPAPELVQGCCSYGAHFVDGDDRRRVEERAARLTPEQWQHHGGPHKRPTKRTADGELVTRLVDGACIFLNRPGFPAGPGCALHQAALAAGERPMDWKPTVCWQLPLRREEETRADGRVVSTIRQWDRGDWGEGGHEFHWWCTDAPEAFVGRRPVYLELRDELVQLTSRWAYEQAAAYCRSVAPRALAHPAAADQVRP